MKWDAPNEASMKRSGAKHHANRVVFCYDVINMFTVYILQSEVDQRYYYGYTEQTAEQRLDEHNAGRSFHTRKYRPWKLVWFGVFTTKIAAQNFEKYLKTPSGHAFSRKRFV